MRATGLYPRLHLNTSASLAVGQAGGVVLTQTITTTGLGTALWQALSPWGKPLAIHDPAKIILDLAVAVSLGRECLADVALLGAEPGESPPTRRSRARLMPSRQMLPRH